MLARWFRIAQLLELLACLAVGAWLYAAQGWGPLAIAVGIVAWIAGVRLVLVVISSLLGWMFRSPRPADQRIGVARAIVLVLGEWRALLAFNLLYGPWAKLLLRPDPPLQPTDRVPVILVHGYFANRGYFRPLVRRLDALGVGPVFVPSFDSWLAPLESFAEELHAYVERIAAGTGQPRVVVVAHSMGGLIARAYIARHGAGRVAALVTIASPHRGTALAALGVGANARQMEEGSGFLSELERSEAAAPSRPPATCIYSPHDNMVAPQASGRLPWARNVALPGWGHIAIVGSAALAQALLPELEAAGVKIPR
jgi:pimeloyl-ACP methyl ester carboxylesterase